MSIGFICLVICCWLSLVAAFRALTGWQLPETTPRHSRSGRVTVGEIRARLAAEIDRNRPHTNIVSVAESAGARSRG
jgi:hypothetical protein